VWAKRDDVMELALGGNKARKLEYILGYAVSRGYNVVVTSGALQLKASPFRAGMSRKAYKLVCLYVCWWCIWSG
jgi:1-aminocyclopropane-1-carboxylate deaminase/D-cysteine desulfhydrase-like pyridoxal-dependent ACC family enzyme